MIVVLTGTGPPFRRLLEAMAAYARSHPDEPVWAQHGQASLPEGLSGAAFLPRVELLSRVGEASVVVTHAGSGSLLDCADTGHVPVVVPRLERHSEIVNDHQLDLARELEREQRAILVEDVRDLEAAILKCRSLGRRKHEAPSARLLASVARDASELVPRSRARWFWRISRPLTAWVPIQEAPRER